MAPDQLIELDLERMPATNTQESSMPLAHARLLGPGIHRSIGYGRTDSIF